MDHRQVAIVLVCLLGGARSAGDDCNRNGVPDEQEIRVTPGLAAPPAILLEKVPFRIQAMDFNADGSPDLAVSLTSGDSISIFPHPGGRELSAAITVPAGDSTFGLTSADFNGDGLPDLATNEGSGQLAVIKNKGNWTFAAPVLFQIAHESIEVRSADLDGDASIDLAVTTPNGLQRLKGLGNGDFQVATSIFTRFGGRFWGLSVADLNGDGQLDLVTAGTSKFMAAALLNDGQGGFQPSIEFPLENLAVAPVIADLDQNGVMDLAVGGGSGMLWLFFNWGSQTFGFPQERLLFPDASTTLANQSISDLKASDLDGDGSVDLMGSAAEIFVLPGLGMGRFGSPQFLDAVSLANSLTVVDLDGDGYSDLVAAASVPPSLELFWRAGVDGFPAASPLHIPGNEGLAVLDLDGDGRLDVARADSAGSQLTISWNRSGRTFTAFPEYRVQSVIRAVACRDFDGDGIDDVAVASGYDLGGASPSTVSLLANRGDGTFRLAEPIAAFTGEMPRSLVAVDLDGDARWDLAAGCDISQSVNLLWNDTVSPFTDETVVSLGHRAISLAAPDYDGDGHPDLAVLADGLKLVHNDGGRQFSPGAELPLGEFAFADLDGDGDLDAAGGDFQFSEVALLENRGGVFTPVGSATNSFRPTALEAGDVDGDGRVDLVGVYDRDLRVLWNLGQWRFEELSRQAVTGTGATALTDLDGDGRLDIALGSNDISIHRYQQVRKLAPPAYLAANGYGALTATDLDRDGLPDLIAANGYGDSITVLLNRDFGVGPQQIALDDRPEVLAGADMDGDGRPDLIAQVGQRLEVFKNEGGRRWSPGPSTVVGSYAHRALALDLDGDRHPDLATAGTVGGGPYKLILYWNQGDGSFVVPGTTVASGIVSSSVVAADLDGDGTVDLAFVDQTSGMILVHSQSAPRSFAHKLTVVPNSQVFQLAAADLDGDGLRDLFWVDASIPKLFIFLNQAGATFVKASDLPLPSRPDQRWSVNAVDLDGDGRPEIAAAGPGFIEFLRHTGGGIFTPLETFKVPSDEPIQWVDVDGDRSVDLVSGQRDSVVITWSRGSTKDCDSNSVLDECEIASGIAADCNLNGIPDACELAGGSAGDCDQDGVLDQCEIADGSSPDCNSNGVPDGCEIAQGAAGDCNANGIPDQCDIAGGRSRDLNGGHPNGIPDECEPALFRRGDANGDGDLDLSDALFVITAIFLDPAALACREAADADDGGAIEVTDCLVILQYLFLDGPPPALPGPPPGPCGVDPDPVGSAGDLGCGSYLRC